MTSSDPNLTRAEPLATISEAERLSGVPKETLRVWERRYGFPAPVRDAAGDRLYPPEQVEKLRLIKLLVDRGERPSRLVRLSLVDLAAETGAGDVPANEVDPWVAEALAQLRNHDVEGLRNRLVSTLYSQGLRPFVQDNAARITRAVGDEWVNGRLQVYEEHLFTELLVRVLRGALDGLPRSDGARPRILLTTLPGEPHGLGLLMAECMMSLAGARCVALGVETPIDDIARAAAGHRADAVALSISAMTSPEAARAGVAALRGALPTKVEIWAGGGGSDAVETRAGVRIISNLAGIEDTVRAWRPRAA